MHRGGHCRAAGRHAPDLAVAECDDEGEDLGWRVGGRWCGGDCLCCEFSFLLCVALVRDCMLDLCGPVGRTVGHFWCLFNWEDKGGSVAREGTFGALASDVR